MKKLLTILLILLCSVSYAQSPSGTNNTPNANKLTPETRLGDIVKWFVIDSGLTVNKKSFFQDTVFFKGRAYSNVQPSLSDSGSQIATTQFIKRLLGTGGLAGLYVKDVYKNATADSFIVRYGNDSTAARKDSIAQTSFQHDTVLVQAPLLVTIINPYKIRLAADTGRATSQLVTGGGLMTAIDSLGTLIGPGGFTGWDDILAQDQDQSADRKVQLKNHDLTIWHDDTGGGKAIEINGGTVSITSSGAQGISIADDSIRITQPNTSSDTTIYKPWGVSSSGGIVQMNSWPSSGGGTPTLTANQIAFGDGSNLMTSSSDLAWDGAILTTSGAIQTGAFTADQNKIQGTGENRLGDVNAGIEINVSGTGGDSKIYIVSPTNGTEVTGDVGITGRLAVSGQTMLTNLGAMGGGIVTAANITGALSVVAGTISNFGTIDYQTPTTGATISSIVGSNIIEPAGPLLALTVNLPASPNNGDIAAYTFTTAITALTFSGGTVVNTVTTTAAGGTIKFINYSGTNKWYKWQ